jgi:hypothetical protein
VVALFQILLGSSPIASNVVVVVANGLKKHFRKNGDEPIRISDIKKPFNEQPRINIQGKSDQNAAYEKNFPRYIAPMDISNSNSGTKMQYKELILYDGFMMQRLFETISTSTSTQVFCYHIEYVCSGNQTFTNPPRLVVVLVWDRPVP